MLALGDYIKLILKKRGLTIVELAKKMTKLERENDSDIKITNTHLSPELKYDKITLERARKIEVALGLPKFQLVNMIEPNLTPKQKERLDKIYKKSLKKSDI